MAAFEFSDQEKRTILVSVIIAQGETDLDLACEKAGKLITWVKYNTPPSWQSQPSDDDVTEESIE